MRALFRLDVQRTSQRPSMPQLPIAALPQNPGETYSVYRAKFRPVLVVSTGGIQVERALTRRSAKWQSVRTYLVAPYFGASASSQRGGWKPELVRFIRHCKYPQYFWEQLPTGDQSILRLDQIQPIGQHHEAMEYTPHRLSDEALYVLDQWLVWYLSDRIDPNDILSVAREELSKLTV